MEKKNNKNYIKQPKNRIDENNLKFETFKTARKHEKHI